LITHTAISTDYISITKLTIKLPYLHHLFFPQLQVYHSPEKFSALESDFAACKSALSYARSEIGALSSERGRLAAEAEVAEQDLRSAREAAEELREALEEATKVSCGTASLIVKE
jgi:hypothetical protein